MNFGSAYLAKEVSSFQSVSRTSEGSVKSFLFFNSENASW